MKRTEKFENFFFNSDETFLKIGGFFFFFKIEKQTDF